MNRGNPLAVFVALLISAAVFVAVSSGYLPERVASHFGGDGYADGYMTRDGYRQFMLFFVVVFPLVLTGLIGWLPRRFPRAINIPNRDYWLAPSRREESLAFLARHALWFGCMLVVFLAGVHWLVVRANTVNPPRLANGPFLAMLVVFLAFMGVWTVALLRRFRKVR
jgi:hypothetical protein